MKHTNWRKLYYHLKHRYLSLNTVVLVVALIIAAGWAWGSVSVMQRNYDLQRKLDTKERTLTLRQLEVQTLEYQKRYYQSTEYQELAARRDLGLAAPGERVLILPPNSEKAKQYDTDYEKIEPAKTQSQPSNFELWLRFLSGKNARSLQE